jgi:hypothetical protein
VDCYFHCPGQGIIWYPDQSNTPPLLIAGPDRLPFITGSYRAVWDFMDAQDLAKPKSNPSRQLRGDMNSRQKLQRAKGKPGAMVISERNYNTLAAQVEKQVQRVGDERRRIRDAGGGSVDRFLQVPEDQLNEMPMTVVDRATVISKGMFKALEAVAAALGPGNVF